MGAGRRRLGRRFKDAMMVSLPVRLLCPPPLLSLLLLRLTQLGGRLLPLCRHTLIIHAPYSPARPPTNPRPLSHSLPTTTTRNADVTANVNAQITNLDPKQAFRAAPKMWGLFAKKYGEFWRGVWVFFGRVLGDCGFDEVLAYAK